MKNTSVLSKKPLLTSNQRCCDVIKDRVTFLFYVQHRTNIILEPFSTRTQPRASLKNNNNRKKKKKKPVRYIVFSLRLEPNLD